MQEGEQAVMSRGPFGASASEPTESADEDIGGKATSPQQDNSTTAPASSSASSDSGNHKSTVGIAAGVSAGVVVLGIIAGIVFFLMYKKRKKEKKAKDALAAAEMSNNDSYAYGAAEGKHDPGSQRSSGWFAPGGVKSPTSPQSPGFTQSSIPPPISELDNTTSTTGSPTKTGPPRYSGIYPGQQPQTFEMADNSILRGPASPLLGQGPASPAFSDGGSQWGGTNTVSEISEVDGRERHSRTAYGGNLGPVDEKGGFSVQS